MNKQLYFAYGSNMNLDQMARRCPEAEVVGNVRLEGHELAFRGSGVLTILPKEGSSVDGVLWRVSDQDIQRLNGYEGYPRYYRREYRVVKDAKGRTHKSMVYIMNTPYKDEPAIPSRGYLYAVLEGCRQNRIPGQSVLNAAEQATREAKSDHATQKATYR